MAWTRVGDFDNMFRAMNQLRNRMEKVFTEEDTFGNESIWHVAECEPKINLYDSGEKLEIRAEVPSISKDDINIKILGNYLEISGNRSFDSPDGYTQHRVERESADFLRSFTLPCDVDSNDVEASLKNGILTLTMPKSEKEKAKRIPVH